MKSKVIQLFTVSEINNFVNKANTVEGDIVVRRGTYAVDGKSAIGVTYITDYNSPITVEYPEDAIDFEEYLEGLS